MGKRKRGRSIVPWGAKWSFVQRTWVVLIYEEPQRQLHNWRACVRQRNAKTLFLLIPWAIINAYSCAKAESDPDLFISILLVVSLVSILVSQPRRFYSFQLYVLPNLEMSCNKIVSLEWFFNSTIMGTINVELTCSIPYRILLWLQDIQRLKVKRAPGESPAMIPSF